MSFDSEDSDDDDDDDNDDDEDSNSNDTWQSEESLESEAEINYAFGNESSAVGDNDGVEDESLEMSFDNVSKENFADEENYQDMPEE